MSTLNKHQVYDTTLSPLVAQILTICKQHGIAVLMDFKIPTPDEPDLCCTTVQPDETGKNPKEHKVALRILMGEPVMAAIAITTTKGTVQ